MAGRVTESLRRQWTNQLNQAREELASGEYQDGEPITAEGRAEFRQEIWTMQELLARCPVGTKIPEGGVKEFLR